MSKTSDDYNAWVFNSLCVDYSSECGGGVEYHTVGPRMRALPLCTVHAEQRTGVPVEYGE